MRLRGLLVLLLIAGGLGFGLWATRRPAAREQEQTESLLGGRRLADATRFVIQRAPDVPPLHFAHESPVDPFRLVEPVVDLASRAFVDQLAAILDSAQRFLDDEIADIKAARLAQLGLDQPRARLEVRYPDKTFTIDIGLEGPLHQDLYVAMDGRAYRTGLAVYSAIQVNADDVRERLLIQSPLDDVRHLTLRRRVGGEEVSGNLRVEVVEIERLGMVDFRLVQPIRTQADTAAVVALLSFLGGMAVDDFLGALNPMPDWDVQIEVQGSRGLERITVWKTPQGLIGRQEPRGIEFTIKSVDYTRTFEVPIDELRARLLVPMDLRDIGRIEIDPGQGHGDRIQLRRATGDDMHMFQPVDVATDPAAVNELLQATQKLSVVEFVDAPPNALADYGLASGFLTVSLHPRPQETNATVLHFGRDEGEHTFVKRGSEEFVAKVPKAVVDVLRRSWPVYASRAAAIGVPAGASAIHYAHRGEDVAVLQRDQSGKWTGREGAGDATDQAVELLDLLGTLRGRRTLDAQDPANATELQAAERMEVTVSAASGARSRPLVLFDRGREGSTVKQAWVVDPRVPRVIVELGVSDTMALLAPLPR